MALWLEYRARTLAIMQASHYTSRAFVPRNFRLRWPWTIRRPVPLQRQPAGEGGRTCGCGDPPARDLALFESHCMFAEKLLNLSNGKRSGALEQARNPLKEPLKSLGSNGLYDH